MKDTAICIFAYNRLEHLKVTIEALLRQDVSKYDIYIFQDGPKNAEDRKKTTKVKAYIESLDKNIFEHKKYSDRNIGLAHSVFNGLTWITERHEQFIVLEDDIQIEPGFLEFMEKGLNSYQEDARVAGISGFSYLQKTLTTNYFLPIGCSWGWASWKRVWKEVKLDPTYYLHQINELNLAKKFNFGTYPFYAILKHADKKLNDSWAICFYSSFFLKNQLFLFPNMSLCRNIGFDGSGTHTGPDQENFNANISSAQSNLEMPVVELKHTTVRKLKRRMKQMAGKNIFQYWQKRIINFIND